MQTAPFSKDSAAAARIALDVLRRAGQPLSAGQIKQALQAAGLDPAAAAAAWPRIQRRLRSNCQVVVEPGHRYRYRFAGAAGAAGTVAAGEAASAAEAAEAASAAGTVPGAVEAVAAAGTAGMVAASGAAEPSARDPSEVDLVRTLAQLAIEIEEMAVNQASTRAVVHRVRALAQRAGLTPIDRAGEESTLDRLRHEPVGRPIPDGTPVVVLRPGYLWRRAGADVLLFRAVVQEARDAGA